ncbi:glycosyltransferase [Flavobacterium urocaniciphilum]|uniref:Glycosyltransferase involved in cell wall bisynthesis n=1 Tax=Flavobacterium urocaniciphilum TaxID=1299341 RepID=A0A1H9DGK9_9FLAO|nr:glycosyltransferase [Flavobacterium urocaniciphilum]SEQ12447.1 Glycosyltransferase involved in cell wall bisynthesis [Flavobacterium urocaniciphilum]
MSFNLKHIVFLTPGFAQNESDTTTIPALQEYIFALKKELPELQITIIAFQFPYTKKKYNWHNCNVIPLNGKNKKLKKIQIWNAAFQILKKLNAELPISILHSFWLGECAFVGNLFSNKYNIKHICTLMGRDVKKKNLYSKLLPVQNMKLICLSSFQQQHFFKNYLLQPDIISWGISKTKFSKTKTKTIDIIGVGSLIPLKNYELFIEVIFELYKSTPIRAQLIGEGIEKEKLQEKIKNLNLENTITFTGLLPYQETLEQVSKAKVLLHTSSFESFGMIFPEAIESNTLIVSKNVGCVVPTENWLLAETKEEMISACKKALSISFSENFNNPFTIEKTVENYLKVYHE